MDYQKYDEYLSRFLYKDVYLEDGGSKIIRIKDMSDVVKWVEPVCINLQKL